MTFSSIFFLFRFLPIFLIVYFMAPGRMKNIVLFLGSLFFCGWGSPRGALYVCIALLFNYVLGRMLCSCENNGNRRLLLIFGTVCNLLFPTGFTIFTLQALSYLGDCYGDREKPQKNLLDFAVYFTLFPQTVAGPVVRYGQIKESLRERKPDSLLVSYGLKRFIIGLSKTVLLANNLGALWTQAATKSVSGISTLTAWIGVVALTYQMYFLLSGTADMAIGLGAVLGFRFPENFAYPYMAGSVTEFSKKCCITLVDWFRDYIYEPLAGEKKSRFRALPGILLTGLLLGLWLGRDVSFVVFGLWFAFWMVLEQLGLHKLLEHIPGIIGRGYTFFTVLVGWVLFAMDSWKEAAHYLLTMFGIGPQPLYDRESLFWGSHVWMLLAVAMIGATPLCSLAEKRLRASVSGAGLALYRFLEKLIVAVLLLVSIAYCVKTPMMLSY